MLRRGLLQQHANLVSLAIRISDIFSLLISGLVAYWFRFGWQSIPPLYQFALLSSALLTAIIFPIFGLYASWRGRGFIHQIWQLTLAWASVLIGLIIIASLTQLTNYYSRLWLVYWAIVGWVMLVILHTLLLGLQRYFRKRGWNQRRIVVIGAGDLGKKMVQAIAEDHGIGFQVVALLDDYLPVDQAYFLNISILKTPANIPEYVKQAHIDEVWLALPLRAEARVKEILNDLRHITVTTRFVLDIFGLDLLNHSLTDIAGVPVLNIKSTPMQGVNRLIKALEDRVLSALILLLISPLLIVIAILVKLDSPGPVFYRQERVSWNGKCFDMLKFRSMPVNAEAATGPVWAKAGENRATRIGSFLRKTSLDELPQFINVLKGDMSIVGPRPERPHFVEQFKEVVPRYMQKHLVKAGITGWAQINGLRGNTSLEKRIEYDLFYIEHWSVWFDIKIIFLTLWKGFFSKNAY